MTTQDKCHPNPDIERWNNKYSTQPSIHSPTSILIPKGEAELVTNAHLLKGAGLALEVASGKGRNAMYLATLGYQVIAADCAINGLIQGQQAARDSNLTMDSVVCDLEHYQFPTDVFELVSVIRFLQRPLFDKIASWVKPGGFLFYKTFNQDYLTSHPRFNPDYVVDSRELEGVFPGFVILASSSLRHKTESLNEDQTLSGSSFILAQKQSN